MMCVCTGDVYVDVLTMKTRSKRRRATTATTTTKHGLEADQKLRTGQTKLFFFFFFFQKWTMNDERAAAGLVYYCYVKTLRGLKASSTFAIQLIATLFFPVGRKMRISLWVRKPALLVGAGALSHCNEAPTLWSSSWAVPSICFRILLRAGFADLLPMVPKINSDKPRPFFFKQLAKGLFFEP